MDKKTIQDMHALAESRGGKCLSEHYVNNKTKLEWQCEKGHKWMARPDQILRGTWCIICAGKQKYTIEFCKEVGKQRQGECISNEYINCQTPLTWKCSKGHTWKSCLSNVINQNRWCPHCYGNVKHTINDMREFAQKKGGRCLSEEYSGNKIKLKWECKKGHIWEARPNDVLNGHWCDKCGSKRAGEKCKLDINELKILARNRKGELISQEYIDGKHKLEWKCENGHTFYMTSVSAKTGQWCPICAKRDKSERICRYFFEEIFKKKFPKARPKWLVTNAGRRLELDGYCMELNLAFEYQGMQHYKYVNKFHKTRSLEEQKAVDLLKREICEKNDVKLIIIAYTCLPKYLQNYILGRCKRMNIPTPELNYVIDYKSLDVFSSKMLQEVKKIAESKGGVCLSEKYIDRDEKMTFRCKNNHVFEKSPRVLKRGSWCPECKKKKNNIELK